ncbi:MAG TPA: 2OG-Fe dioxygenase family protein [Steroidobacteraceae bacterium]|jgi:hypothetical protein
MKDDSGFDGAVAALVAAGYSLLSPTQFSRVVGVPLSDLNALSGSWTGLPPDEYLRDGGHYRSRRHSCFVQELMRQGGLRGDSAQAPATAPQDALRQVDHRAHWQPTTYNALHGGIERWFEPVEPRVATASAWLNVVTALGRLFHRARAADRWHIEAHQFRIDTANGIGRPTPEGAHRDGVDFVAVILVNRQQVRGGETRVFDAHGTSGQRFTMADPWSALLMDDAKVIHETTPIQPDGGVGVRDTLVLTYRAGGFQSQEK